MEGIATVTEEEVSEELVKLAQSVAQIEDTDLRNEAYCGAVENIPAGMTFEFANLVRRALGIRVVEVLPENINRPKFDRLKAARSLPKKWAKLAAKIVRLYLHDPDRFDRVMTMLARATPDNDTGLAFTACVALLADKRRIMLNKQEEGCPL